MKNSSCTVMALAFVAAATAVLAQNDLGLLRLAPGDFEWDEDLTQVARIDIAGDRTQAGMYAYRVRFPTGFRNEPHFHPDDRIVTVIAGTLHVGLGERIDEASMRPLPAGSLWTEPSGEAHYVWAKSGEVIIQVIGYGPSSTTQVEQ